MVKFRATRYADVSNATLLANRLRESGSMRVDQFADWVENVPDDDRRILFLEWAGSFSAGICLLGEEALKCLESWLSGRLPENHGQMLGELAAAARHDWPSVDDDHEDPDEASVGA